MRAIKVFNTHKESLQLEPHTVSSTPESMYSYGELQGKAGFHLRGGGGGR